MRISKTGFSAEIRVSGNSERSGFRYVLFECIAGDDRLLYESHLFRQKRNCVAKADEHLERLSSWVNLKTRLLKWAA